ncbi:MAG: hypothetical protein EOQ86_26600, partial [Mesorhizobium sp.]
LLPYCPTALLPYCPTALLPYCPTPLLPYSPTALLPSVGERVRRHAVVRALWRYAGSCCSGPSWPQSSRRSALDRPLPMPWNRLLG